MTKIVIILSLLICINTAFGQPDRWQQRISYDINVDMNVGTNVIKGTEKIVYTNNSPDTLNRIFFHTYWNAFQPNSIMDSRSRELGKTILGQSRNGENIRDWDGRVKDRILNLTPQETGYQKVIAVTINGQKQELKDHETILEVVLMKPLLPKTKVFMEVEFEAQVPLQVRRSGRDNVEGVRYSMSQWYPKVVEYDYTGWSANPYVASEFYGVWGDYNVNITIDKNYMIAGTGTLQNADKIGFGYSTPQLKVARPTGNTLTWKFAANNVHDFMWAADPGYTMIKKELDNGPTLFIVFKTGTAESDARWQLLADTVALAYPIMAKLFGAYPYKNYSFIQGGDGGMEYPMATLLRSASIGTAIHEWMHSWYQGMMGSNEFLYPWMDEGFTNYASARIEYELMGKQAFEQQGNYDAYLRLAKSGYEEPMATPADFFTTNYAYGSAAYGKGAVFLSQLGYIVGAGARDSILLAYYNAWRFKHPNPADFVRVAEKVSGMELKWYKEFWLYTTKTINYSIDSLWEADGKTNIRVKRIGEIPMPVDVQVTYKDGSKEMHYMPLDMMYGAKPATEGENRIVHPEWVWTRNTYVFSTDKKLTDITEVQIDPSQTMADTDLKNNTLKLKW